jgi:hypothetical protein
MLEKQGKVPRLIKFKIKVNCEDEAVTRQVGEALNQVLLVIPSSPIIPPYIEGEDYHQYWLGSMLLGGDNE